jgi:hypothetical protein
LEIQYDIVVLSISAPKKKLDKIVILVFFVFRVLYKSNIARLRYASGHVAIV